MVSSVWPEIHKQQGTKLFVEAVERHKRMGWYNKETWQQSPLSDLQTQRWWLLTHARLSTCNVKHEPVCSGVYYRPSKKLAVPTLTYPAWVHCSVITGN